MSNDHGNLIKTPKQLIIMVFLSFFVPLIVILLLMVYVDNGTRTGGDAEEASKSADQLIKPVAQLDFQDANAPRAMKTGAQVYKAACASCHDNGAAGAPRYNNAGDWAGRLGKGYDALLSSVIKGKGAMPARGGANPADINDHELGLSVVYLTASSGGKFPEPKAPAAAPAEAAAK
jgi:cytochrome c5